MRGIRRKVFGIDLHKAFAGNTAFKTTFGITMILGAFGSFSGQYN